MTSSSLCLGFSGDHSSVQKQILTLQLEVFDGVPRCGFSPERICEEWVVSSEHVQAFPVSRVAKPSRPSKMAKNIVFVGNLSYETTAESVKGLFKGCGEPVVRMFEKADQRIKN